ncbi:streptophobe family protein [Streptomyces sp. NPDC101776]|uniref:streptophobe family protein n=1 Tax=Streptomyces sp. NPDC101776 TaxID=3366146 RepID=UPI0038173B2E
MSSATSVRTASYDTRVPWGDVLLSAIAAVSWALIGMAGTAALGLHLLGADATGSLGPMTAAVVALGAGGSVTPTGDVSAFGLTGAQATTAVTITPLGVSLVGALLLSYFFLRSLRAAGVVISPAELLARAGSVIALFVAMLGGLAWAGHDVITIDGSKLGLDKLTGGGGSGGGVNIPGIGDIGDIGGLLPGKISDLVKAKAAVGFTVDTAPTLLGGLGWSAGILLIALLASRRTPLPRGWEAVHRVVRPAASALVAVLLVAVAAGLAAAAYAAIGDDHPKRIGGAALLGAPNGVWLGIPIGLFVPWDGKATGELAKLLPHPLDDLLSAKSDQPVTLGRLAELDGRVWLLGVAAGLMMLLAGVLTAVRTPVGARAVGGAGVGTGVRSPVGGAGVGAEARWDSGAGANSGRRGSAGAGNPGALGFAGRCALRLGVVTAIALPLLAWLTDVSVDASLSVLGFDAFGAGIELHGHLGMALVLGAVWGAGAGAVGGLLAYATGAAGRQASRLALGDLGATGSGTGSGSGSGSGSRSDSGYGSDSDGWAPGQPGYPEHAPSAGGAGRAGHPETAGDPGPYVPSSPYRAPNPATNPYLQVPDELRQPEDGGPPPPRGAAWPGGKQRGQGGGAVPRGPGAGGSGSGGSGPGGAGPDGGGRSRGPGWPPGAGSPTEGVWPPGARSPQEGGRPPARNPRSSGDPQPPGNAGQFGTGPAPGGVGPGRGGPYPGGAPSADGARAGGAAQSPGTPPPPVDMYGAPTMAQSYEPPSRPPRRPPGARPGDWPEDDSDGGQQPPTPPPSPPPPPPPPGRPKGRR